MKTNSPQRATAAAGTVGLVAAAFFALAPGANAVESTASTSTSASESTSHSTKTESTKPETKTESTKTESTKTESTSASSSTTTAATSTSGPTCLSGATAIAAALSYTYHADGSGSITLSGSLPLCQPLHVRVQTWKFVNPASMWPQTPVGADIFDFTSVGVHPFTAPARICGQTDVYASFKASDLAIPATLLGPSRPFEPPFIFSVAGMEGLPWTVDNTPCVTPSPSTSESTTVSTSPSTSTSGSTSPSTSTSGSTSPSTSTSGSTSPSTSTSGSTSTSATATPTVIVTPTVTATSPGVTVSGTSTTEVSTPPVTATSTATSPGVSVSGTSTETSPGVSVSGTSTANTPTPTATAPPGVLPFTGSHTGSIALFGALGILAGLVLMIATRKPRRQ